MKPHARKPRARRADAIEYEDVRKEVPLNVWLRTDTPLSGALHWGVSPVPNFLAGIAIALAVTNWGALVIACLAWAFAVCGFVWIKEGRAERMAISYYQGHGERLFGSPAFTFYAIEWTTALIIALMVATAIFAIRKMFV